MTYIGGVGDFAGPIIGAVIITFLQITLSDVTSAWQLYFGLIFIGVVLFSPGGLAGWLMLHREAALRGEIWRLGAGLRGWSRRLSRQALRGAMMLIELADRQFALARSEGSVMRLFGFEVDAATAGPWIIADRAVLRRRWRRVDCSGRGSSTPGAS